MKYSVRCWLVTGVLFGTATASADDAHLLVTQLRQAVADRHLPAVQNTCELLLLDLACGRNSVPAAQRMPMAMACVQARKGDWQDAASLLTQPGVAAPAPSRIPLAPFVASKRIAPSR